jgi:hypothetical protein
MARDLDRRFTDLVGMARRFSALETPSMMVNNLIPYFLSMPLSANALLKLQNAVSGGVPDEDWNPGTPEADIRLRQMMGLLFELPEFQLT